MGVREGNTLWIPRECARIGAEDFRTLHTPSAINCNFVPRFPEQETLITQSAALLQQDKNHIFQAATGWGKTVAGTVIAARLGQPTIILVTKQDLLDQWRDTFLKMGIPPSLIGHVQQDECVWKGKMFVTAMVHSVVIPGRYPSEMYKYFGFLVLDEVHKMAADTFIQAVQLFYARYRLGFSATPERKDGKTRLLNAHIGPTMVVGKINPMAPKVLVRQTGWRIPQVKTYTPEGVLYKKISHAPGRMTLVTKAQALDMARNSDIVQYALAAYKSGRRCLCLSDLIDGHLHPLFKLLTHAGIPGEDIGYYIGGLTKTARDANKMKKVILATFKMCSEGTNVPEWDTCVLCTPRADVTQPIGRILREFDGKRQPLILDLVDYDSIFQNFYVSRQKQYLSIGATIVRM
jgi:superfamily II DNA or RNA helicase